MKNKLPFRDISKLKIDPDLAGLFGSIGAFALGAGLLLDDAKDLGEFSSEKHPSPLHHWQWGTGLMLISSVGISAFGARVLQKADHIRKNNK